MTPAVVVVGSGPAGVSAAWPLVRAGADVLMLDASRDESGLPPPPSGGLAELRASPERWRVRFGADLAGLGAGGDTSPKLATPLARLALGRFAAATGLSTQGFLALGSLERGGLSRIWGAVAARYRDEELREAGLPPAELAASYDAVMARIGVSGDSRQDGQPVEEGPALTAAAALLAERQARKPPAAGLRLARATNAVLTSDRPGRDGCTRCGLCLWGCARGSIYDSASELGQLLTYPNFRYRPGCFVTELSAGGRGQVLTVRGSGGPERLTAPFAILAAGTIGTTALALRRLGRLGEPVRLLSNPVAAIAFLAPSLVGSALPDRSFALAQLGYELELPGGGAAAGAFYGADTLPLADLAARMPLSRPAALRLARALAPALLLATVYLPGRFSRNSIRVERDGVRIEGAVPEATRAELTACGRRLARHMRRLGLHAVPGSLTVSPAGADAHYAGTLPSGGPLGTSSDGELPGCPGLHVADGSLLRDLPARHCTLTVMANADRIGHALAARMTHSVGRMLVIPD